MPSEKADPKTETLPAEQANPAAPAPNVGAQDSSAPAQAEGGETGEDGKPSKKGGELEAQSETERKHADKLQQRKQRRQLRNRPSRLHEE
jgi:hypothetical protein